MALSGAASLAGLSGTANAAEGSARVYYELRQYHIETEQQKEAFLAFMRDAAIPALNRLGIGPVGVFLPAEDLSPIYALLCHPSLESFATMTQQLDTDATFGANGAAFLNASPPDSAYTLMESSLMIAFTGMPCLERPIEAADRIFQLRTYESPSVVAGQKKIEMFNEGEIDIFRKTGLNPVFFGETLAGAKMPNLTYILTFNNMDEQKAAWKRFIADSEWLELSAIPEYANEKIIRGITNLSLKPAECSQV